MKTEVGRYGHGEVDDTNCNDSNHNSCGDRETLEYGQRVSSMLGHWMASREYSDTVCVYVLVSIYMFVSLI